MRLLLIFLFYPYVSEWFQSPEDRRAVFGGRLR